MPKMKTNRGAKKRFRFTSSGKVKRNKAFGNHILTKKTTKRKRNIRKSAVMSKADTSRVKRMVPGG